MESYLVIALLIALLGGCSPATNETPEKLAESEAPAKIFAMPYLLREMDDGLRVIIVQTEYPDIVTLQIPVQTGSRNEVETGKSGFAHFFEHMMFRGTEKYPSDAYTNILKNAGASMDPVGKKGLAALTAAMLTDAGSTNATIQEINAAMYPIASGFNAHVDKEMTRLSGQVHKDNMQYLFVTSDAADLKIRLASEQPSPMIYATEKSTDLLDEDQVIQSMRLRIDAADIRVISAEEVFN